MKCLLEVDFFVVYNLNTSKEFEYSSLLNAQESLKEKKLNSECPDLWHIRAELSY